MSRKKASAWSKSVRKELIDRDMTITDLAKEMSKSRDYVIGVVNERIISETARKDISDFLNIPYVVHESA